MADEAQLPKTVSNLEKLWKAVLDKIEGGVTPTGSVEISANGVYDVTEYADAEVEVPQTGATLFEYGPFSVGDMLPVSVSTAINLAVTKTNRNIGVFEDEGGNYAAIISREASENDNVNETTVVALANDFVITLKFETVNRTITALLGANSITIRRINPSYS